MVTNKFLRSLGTLALLGTVFSCSSEAALDGVEVETPSGVAADGETLGADVEQEAEQPSEVAIGHIVLDNGTTVTISEVEDGPVSVVMNTPEAALAEMQEALQGVHAVEHFYTALAPQLEMPSKVVSALARLAASPEKFPFLGDSLGVDTENLVDAMLVQTKEAPRDVQGFINNVCQADHVVESSITGIYARRPVACQTERTGNSTTTVTGSKQLIAGVRPYRGTIDQKWHWKNGANWTLGGTQTAVEGQYQFIWIFNNALPDLRIEIANATGDGFNRFIETTDANPVNQKSLAGNDYYQQECSCVKSGQLPIPLKTEGCASNQYVFDNNMTTTCQRYQQVNAYGQYLLAAGYVCGQVIGQWERASFGESCAVNFDVRECSRETCVYKCTDVCRKQ